MRAWMPTLIVRYMIHLRTVKSLLLIADSGHHLLNEDSKLVAETAGA